MLETIVRVLELLNTTEKEKWSSENYLNCNKIIRFLQISFNNSRKLEIQVKSEQLCTFTEIVTFTSRISFIFWMKFYEVAFYFRRDHHYFIYFNLMHLVSLQMDIIKIYM